MVKNGNNVNIGSRYEKKNPVKMLPLVGIEPGPLIASNTILSGLT